MFFRTHLHSISGAGKNKLHNNLFLQLHLHIYIINLIILYIHIVCRKYEEEKQTWMQRRPPQKRRRHDLIGGDSFPKFEEWIANAVNDAEEGQDITVEESELSQFPHVWAMQFSGMWAYGSHLRVEEKDKGKGNCDCVVSAEFLHETEKKFYVGFIQKIIQVDYGENSPILLKCKWVKPSVVQLDEYGFVRANLRQFLSETDEPYVFPLQINQSYLIDDVRSPGWSYVIQTESRSKRKFMEVVDIMPDGQYDKLQETFEEVVEDDDRVIEEETFITNEEIGRENVSHASCEDDEENQEDAHKSDQDSDLGGNADDYDDDLSH